MNSSSTGVDPKTNDFLNQYQPTAESVRRKRLQRLAAGAIYGLLLGAIYALAAGTIDALTFPDLPLQVDWESVRRDVLVSGLGGVALGAIVGWPENSWAGTLLGAGVIVVWEMGRSLLTVRSMVGILLLILVLPLVVLSIPIAGAFRWSVSRHFLVLQRPRLRRRVMGVAGVVLAVLALATFAGSWSRMTGSVESAVRTVNNVLQNALASPQAALPSPLHDLPDFRSRASSHYVLNQQAATSSQSRVNVQITFDNGYVITCLVETDTSTPQIAICAQGTQTPWNATDFSPNDQR